MINSTFYMVSVKLQTESCRSGVKCRLGSWRINRLWPRYRPNREVQERSVKRLEASNTEHRFQDHAYLCSANWTTVREIGFYCPNNRSCRCVRKVYRYIFKGRTKYTWASCMLKLMLLSRTVFSLTREMYLAGCELHIQLGVGGSWRWWLQALLAVLHFQWHYTRLKLMPQTLRVAIT